jgi:bisphosphoglycerate-dependent phosphoglycerate mutase
LTQEKSSVYASIPVTDSNDRVIKKGNPNKAKTSKKYGKDQVLLWRRSFNIFTLLVKKY